MSDKLHTAVFSSVGKCLTPEEMRAYDKGKLSGAEKHRVEKHLLDCELCSEAFDGIVGAGSAAVFSADVAEINARARERAGIKTLGKQGSKTLAWTSAAAVFLAVGITALFWFRGANEEKKLEQIFTQNFELPKAESPVVAEEAGAYVDTLHVSDSDGQLLDALARDKNAANLQKGAGARSQNSRSSIAAVSKDQPAKTIAPAVTNSVTTATPHDVELIQADSRSGGLGDVALADEDAALEENEVAAGRKFYMDEAANENGADDFSGGVAATPPNPISQYLTTDPNQDVVTLSGSVSPGTFSADSASWAVASVDNDKPGKKEKEGKTTAAGEHKQVENAKMSVAPASGGFSMMADGDYNAGIEAYNREDYLMAVNHFEKVLSRAPNHAEANFYAGISYLSLKQSSAAIGCLQRIVNHTNGQLREDARWYLALAYIQKKDAVNAEKQLQMLNRSGGKYQQRAEEALDKLDE